MAKTFPFSIWVYKPLSDSTPDEVNTWAECGINIPMTPAVSWKSDLTRLIPFLDRAEELGIKVIANVGGVAYWDVNSAGEEEVENRLRKIYEVLGGHPALYGFYAGDEPCGAESIKAAEEVYRIHKKVAPELEPFINLIGGMGNKGGAELGDRNIDEWFRDIGKIGVGFVSQDLYGPMINEQTTTWHFKEMKKVVDAAEKAGVDVWANMLSSAHYAYRLPTAHELLWQITTAAACGCRGGIWFRFYDRAEGFEYYGSPIDEFGYKTENYYHMLRAQKRFTQHYGEIIMKLKRKSTFMRGTDRESYPMFETGSHDLIDVNCYEDAIISFFEDEDGKEYMCIVNAYRDFHATIKIYYDAEKCELRERLFNGKRESYIPPCDPANEYSGLSFYPAQFRLFRIDRK